MQTHPSIDPIGFHSLFLVTTLALVDRRRLNMLETCGCLLIILRMPNRCEPFFKGVKEVLEDRGRNQGRGFNFAFELMGRVAEHATVRELHARWNSNHHHLRRPEECVFYRQGYLLFSICLHVFAAFPNKPISSKIAEVYRSADSSRATTDL